MTDEDQADDLRPSKSARKRAAHAAQDLGERLIALKDAELEGLDLPERLRDAIALARTIRSRAGLARQRQYIGKLMRDLDVEPIEAALVARGEQASRQSLEFKRVEAWRERLLREGEAGLDALIAQHPQLDRAEWSRRIAAAQREGPPPGAATAYRELFRALRALLTPPVE
jgi:ribosome-associated protein